MWMSILNIRRKKNCTWCNKKLITNRWDDKRGWCLLVGLPVNFCCRNAYWYGKKSAIKGIASFLGSDILYLLQHSNQHNCGWVVLFFFFWYITNPDILMQFRRKIWSLYLSVMDGGFIFDKMICESTRAYNVYIKG